MPLGDVLCESGDVLQQAGIIRYRRGHITVLDRDSLNAHVCECYAVVKKEFDRLRCDFRNSHIIPEATI